MLLRTRPHTLVALTLALLAPGVAHAQLADERVAVLAVTDSALAAITRSDFIAFTDFMLDSAVIFTAAERDGQVRVGFRRRAQDRAAVIAGTLTERGFRPVVHVSGPLAVVWLPYDFYRNGAWSHCGIDAFTLVKADGRWRIATLAYTVAQPPACEPHPDGAPAGPGR